VSLLLLAAADADQLSIADTAFLKAVGTLLRQRTVARDPGGRELGTFNDLTLPTVAQVLELRDDQAREELEASIGTIAGLIVEWPELTDDVESLLRLGTALQVELTYFAGDVNANRSPYPQHEKRYDRRVALLVTNIARLRNGESTGVEDPTPSPVYSFRLAPCDDDEPAWPRDPRRW
jgi:hypothetical protein